MNEGTKFDGRSTRREYKIAAKEDRGDSGAESLVKVTIVMRGLL